MSWNLVLRKSALNNGCLLCHPCLNHAQYSLWPMTQVIELHGFIQFKSLSVVCAVFVYEHLEASAARRAAVGRRRPRDHLAVRGPLPHAAGRLIKPPAGNNVGRGPPEAARPSRASRRRSSMSPPTQV